MQTVKIQGVELIALNDRICTSVLGILDKTAQGPLPFEPETLPYWEMLCRKEGAVALDIGGYTGLYALVAAKSGAKVVCFEPLERNRKRIQENADLNGVHWVVPRAEAVAEKVGKATITTNLKAVGLSSGSSIVKKVGADALEVKTISIDSLNLPRVDAIKIDVERAEHLVLAGAHETLKRCKPTLIVEVLGEEEESKVMAALPEEYYVKNRLDCRNWIMVSSHA